MLHIMLPASLGSVFIIRPLKKSLWSPFLLPKAVDEDSLTDPSLKSKYLSYFLIHLTILSLQEFSNNPREFNCSLSWYQTCWNMLQRWCHKADLTQVSHTHQHIYLLNTIGDQSWREPLIFPTGFSNALSSFRRVSRQLPGPLVWALRGPRLGWAGPHLQRRLLGN